MASPLQRQITQAFPSMAKELTAIRPEEASDSRWMTELGRFAVAWFEAGSIEEVKSVFGFAEHMIESGSEDERHAAIIGFLETVQNVASRREHGAAVFEQFLGPR